MLSPFPLIFLAPFWFGYRLFPSFRSDAPQRSVAILSTSWDTPVQRGAFGRTQASSTTSCTAEAHTAAAGGNASTAARVEARREEGTECHPTFEPIDNQAIPHQLCHSPPLRAGPSSSGGPDCSRSLELL